jgi:hypothetical protein
MARSGQSRLVHRPDRGAAAEPRVSCAVACGLSVFVLQTAVLERIPCAPPPDEESPALSIPDDGDARSAAVPGPKRGRPLLGAAPFSPSPAVPAAAQLEPLAWAPPPSLRVPDAAAPSAAAAHVAGHRPRGPPRLPS